MTHSAVFHENAFTILVISSKKLYSSFLKKDFWKTRFKVKTMEMLKTSNSRHANLSNGGLF